MNELLAAVCEAPGDDAVRVVYADWLEEHGRGDYAAFIRADVAGDEDTAEWLWQRDREAAWFPGIAACRGMRSLRLFAEGEVFHPSRPQSRVPAGYVRRGFVEVVRCPLAVWLEQAGPVVMRHPVTRVELTDWQALRRRDIPRRFDTLLQAAAKLKGTGVTDDVVSIACLAYAKGLALAPHP